MEQLQEINGQREEFRTQLLTATQVVEVSHVKQLKISVAALMLTVFAVTVGAWFTFQNHAETYEASKIKMDSLYEEIGALSAENTNVYMELQKTQTELSAVQTALDSVNDKLAIVDPNASAQIKVDIETLSEKFAGNKLIKASADANGDVTLAYPEDMVNILLLGQNGGLTDTMMVAALNPVTEKMTLISVPRDLYVSGRKLNSMYYYHGIDKLKGAIQDITGLKISEYAVVDIAALTEIIDILGGVTVHADKDLYDSMYPNGRGGYETFSLSAGEHHLDGATALKFARSRKSTSDFDRAARQQQVIESIYKKVKELNLTENKTEAIKMFETLNEYVVTDIDVFSALAYAKMFKNYDVERNNVLTSSNYLYSMINASGAYILLPNGGNYDEIKSYVFELIVE